MEVSNIFSSKNCSKLGLFMDVSELHAAGAGQKEYDGTTSVDSIPFCWIQIWNGKIFVATVSLRMWIFTVWIWVLFLWSLLILFTEEHYDFFYWGRAWTKMIIDIMTEIGRTFLCYGIKYQAYLVGKQCMFTILLVSLKRISPNFSWEWKKQKKSTRVSILTEETSEWSSTWIYWFQLKVSAFPASWKEFSRAANYSEILICDSGNRCGGIHIRFWERDYLLILQN